MQAVTCEVCGTEFAKKDSEIRRTKHNYCSLPCCRLGRSGLYWAGFLARTKFASSGCLEWTGKKDLDGYGQVEFRGVRMHASRAAWLILKGPIPAGLHVLHTCDNRPCVNHDHLFLGTHQDNMADRMQKRRAAIGRSSEARA